MRHVFPLCKFRAASRGGVVAELLARNSLQQTSLKIPAAELRDLGHLENTKKTFRRDRPTVSRLGTILAHAPELKMIPPVAQLPA